MNTAIPPIGFLWIVTLVAVPAVAQDKASDLKKAGDVYEHGPSKTKFAVPKGWHVLDPQMQGRTAALGLRLPNPQGEGLPGIEATVFWSPLNVSMEEAVNLEQTMLAQTYGQDKVTKPEPAKAGDKAGSKMTVAEGPLCNGKEAGIVYLFQSGSGDDRWKIKIRATVQKASQAESVKEVEELLKGLQ